MNKGIRALVVASIQQTSRQPLDTTNNNDANCRGTKIGREVKPIVAPDKPQTTAPDK